jgi:hypothetical protein
MPSYLVETYLARCRAEERAAVEAGARSAADDLVRAGIRVRFVDVIHVPEDETCFLVVSAPSTREAMQLARLAGLDPIRAVEAVTSGEELRR